MLRQVCLRRFYRLDIIIIKELHPAKSKTDGAYLVVFPLAEGAVGVRNRLLNIVLFIHLKPKGVEIVPISSPISAC